MTPERVRRGLDDARPVDGLLAFFAIVYAGCALTMFAGGMWLTAIGFAALMAIELWAAAM